MHGVVRFSQKYRYRHTIDKMDMKQKKKETCRYIRVLETCTVVIKID